MILIQNDKLRQKMKSDWVSGAKQKSFTIINMRCGNFCKDNQSALVIQQMIGFS